MHMAGTHKHWCMGLGLSKILIHMHMCNMPGRHKVKLVYLQYYRLGNIGQVKCKFEIC
jgi:hypothetical protein